MKYIRQFAPTTEHNGLHMTLAGQWADLAAYYMADNGTAWSWSFCTGSWSCCGDWNDFLARFATQFRGELLPQFKG